VREAPQDGVGASHHYPGRSRRDAPRHPITAAGHGAERSRVRHSRTRGAMIQKGDVSVVEGEPRDHQAKDEAGGGSREAKGL